MSIIRYYLPYLDKNRLFGGFVPPRRFLSEAKSSFILKILIKKPPVWRFCASTEILERSEIQFYFENIN